MKICVIAPTVLPVLGRSQKYGGIEVVITLVVDELVGRGHEVYLLASGDSKTKANLIKISPKALGLGESFDKQKHYNKLAYQKSVRLKPDVIWDHSVAIHAHKKGRDLSTYLFRADIQLLPQKLINTQDIPVVHTLHGPAKDHMPKLIHDLSSSGHYFISISKDQAKRYKNFITKNHHLGTVYNPIDLMLYKPDYNNKKSYFLWVGRYGMEKAPHIALAVAHRLNTPIKFVGKKSEPHEKSYFKNFIKPFLNTSDQVFSCNITVDKKAKLYREAEATLMTNLWPEPFGLVIAESMASGTPVVGPALGSLSELLDSTGILVPTKNLNLNENEIEVTIGQLRYIDRIVKYIKTTKQIPGQVVRKRAEYLFSSSLSALGYEAAFEKAIYLKNNNL